MCMMDMRRVSAPRKIRGRWISSGWIKVCGRVERNKGPGEGLRDGIPRPWSGP